MVRMFGDRKGYKRFSGSKKLVHIWVAEKKVGGRIFPGRVVHHKDGNKSNFRPSNLQVMTRSAHAKLHARKRKSGWW
jgi:hypothetical protein